MYIYYLTNRGLFSELNQLLSTYLYAKRKKQEFKIVTSRSVLYFSKGFHHYFEMPKRIKPRKRLRLFSKVKIIHDHKESLFRKIRHTPFTIEEKKQAAQDVLNLRPHISEKINELTKRLDLPSDYIAIHVRRGDKVGEKKSWTDGKREPEAERYETKEYFSILKDKKADIGHIKAIFILTDDFKAVQETTRYINDNKLDLKIYTLCPESYDGHSSIDRRQNKNYFSEDEVISLLAEVEIAANSSYFVGSLLSFLSKHVVMVHKNPSNCFSLDIEWKA